jgi:hypothetical protein
VIVTEAEIGNQGDANRKVSNKEKSKSSELEAIKKSIRKE